MYLVSIPLNLSSAMGLKSVLQCDHISRSQDHCVKFGRNAIPSFKESDANVSLLSKWYKTG